MFSIPVRVCRYHVRQGSRLFSTSALALTLGSVKQSNKLYNLNEDPEYLKFRNESIHNLSNELEEQLLKFEKRHEDRPKANSRIIEVLDEWGWNIVESPILAPSDFIHMSKAASDGTSIDILIDYRIPEDDSVREMQVIISNPVKGLLYLLGSFYQKRGFVTGSSYVLSKEHNILEFRRGLIEGSAQCFDAMGSSYSKVMENDELKLKEVTWLLQDAISTKAMDSLLGIREKIDIFVNEYIADTTGLSTMMLQEKSAESSKLQNTIWLLIRYSELEARYEWIELFKKFLN